jgi:hypothetical protein
MGATWKTKSMFDLDFEEESFCDLLNASGIETFSFDIPETNHSDVVSICQELITTHNIQNVMGYSYGCLPAMDIALSNEIKNLIMLDPFSGVPIKCEENDSKLHYKTEDVYSTIKEHSYMSELVSLAYIKTLGQSFDVCKFPKQYSKDNFDKYTNWNLHRKLKCNTLVAFTESSKKELRLKFSTLQQRFYPYSHWILLESGRKRLCEDLSAVLK